VPLLSGVKPVVTTKAPGAGYIVPAAFAQQIGERLALHGFKTVPIEKPRMNALVDVYRADTVKFSDKPYEGRMTVKVTGRWEKERVHVQPAAIYVPLDQPGARLLVHLLEPEAPDSFTSWGFFNGAFEQKEYMEDYVAEDFAEQLLRKDAAAKAAFEKRLAEDPAFAADPKKRLEIFYKRHPSYDARKDMVPVYRVDAP
jgi:hypothetical protein